jgi:predicted TIM-barrel fold metal-dependent hydrolase
MPIVDSQVHIWENAKLGAHHRQVATFSQDDLLKEMDDAGVDAAVIHPPGSLDSANDTAVAAARAHPDRFAVLGHFAVDRAENRTRIATWKDRPGMLGLRFTFNQPHQQSWWTDGTLDWLWAAAEQAELPIGLLANGEKLKIVGAVASRHPRLRLLIDHMGRKLGAKDADAFADLDELLALAEHPNVAVKASGAPSYSSEPYPFRNIHPYIRRIFDAFGPTRFFWGTDITRMPCPYRECVRMFTEEMPWLAGRDKDLVMGQALCDWLGWKLPSGASAR